MNTFKFELINKCFYNCITFLTVEETNQFLANNPEYGVLAEEKGKIYVALNSDKGVSPTTEELFKKYKYMAAYGKYAGSDYSYIEMKIWEAWENHAPLNTILKKDDKWVIFDELPEKTKNAVNYYLNK